MKLFTNLFHKRESKEDMQAFYEILGVSKKSELETNPEYIKMAELLKWNSEIEILEEGSANGHTLRVANLSKKMAEELKLSKEDVKIIYYAALFHDIGKHLIPKEITGKPGPLTNEEYDIMKTHTELAEDLVNGIIPEKSIDIIKCHHERMDKSGYPNGVVPNLGARIIGVIDSYDAMTSKRVYSNPKNKYDAFQELERCTIPRDKGGFGELYDIKLVNVLKKIENE